MLNEKKKYQMMTVTAMLDVYDTKLWDWVCDVL